MPPDAAARDGSAALTSSTTTVRAGERPKRWSPGIVPVTWAIATVVLLVMAVRQEHPSDVEHVTAAVVLTVALTITVFMVSATTWRRLAPWLVPLMVTVGTLATWNPLGFYAVFLVAGHPFVVGAGAAAITAKALWPPSSSEHSGLRQATAIAVASLSVGAIGLGALAGLAALAFGRAGFSESTSSGSTRIDFHLAGDCGDGTTAVVRTGDGLMLREGPVSKECSSQTWELVNDHLVVVTCTKYPERALVAGRMINVEPTTMRTLGDTTEDRCAD